jgi:8-oxo-dGTP pyrophosphatase MutT (NUDIX family)
MVASAFLPAAWYQGKLYFLFGKEAHDDSAPGFSDFGGRVEKGEDIYEAGLREMAEETTGFLGGPDNLRALIEHQGGVFRLSHGEYHIHVFRYDYDPKLVEYYNNSHRFVFERMDHAYLRKTMIFEKIEIQWMTLADMRERRSEFRPFYRKIVDKILRYAGPITRFVRLHRAGADARVSAREAREARETRRRLPST